MLSGRGELLIDPDARALIAGYTYVRRLREVLSQLAPFLLDGNFRHLVLLLAALGPFCNRRSSDAQGFQQLLREGPEGAALQEANVSLNQPFDMVEERAHPAARLNQLRVDLIHGLIRESCHGLLERPYLPLGRGLIHGAAGAFLARIGIHLARVQRRPITKRARALLLSAASAVERLSQRTRCLVRDCFCLEPWELA